MQMIFKIDRSKQINEWLKFNCEHNERKWFLFKKLVWIIFNFKMGIINMKSEI